MKVDMHLDGGASRVLLCSKLCSELLQRNLARVLGKPDHTVVLEAADGRESVTHEVRVKFSLGSATMNSPWGIRRDYCIESEEIVNDFPQPSERISESSPQTSP